MAADELFRGSHHAESYAKYRPRYPGQLYETILSSCEGHDLAVDVACGSGQNTQPLATYFTKVIGIDVSQAQVTHALCDAPDNVTYRVGRGEDLSFIDDLTVDLVTCAQGVHWFDLPTFYSHVNRVLKPGGVLALYGYTNPTLDSPESNHALNHLYHGHLGPHWAPGIKIVDNYYKELDFPYDNMKRIEGFVMQVRLSLKNVIGYFSTWSGYRTLLERHPDTNVLSEAEQRIRQVCHSKGISPDADDALLLSWDVFLLIGNKPR